MKNLLLILFTIFIFSACSDENESSSDITGDWKLIEVLIDPGDLSGTFEAVESDKIITFSSNGNVSSNGNLCNLDVDTGVPTFGTYSIADSTFTSNSCPNPNQPYRFEQIDDILIINYPCFEPCKSKYQKQ